MALPVEEDMEVLRATCSVSATDLDGGDVAAIIRDFKLPPGWSKDRSSILIRVPRAYPQAQLDQFSADPDLRLATGAMPANAMLATYAGRDWLQFSYHPRSWRPGVDNLVRYLGFVKGRFMEAR